MPESGDSHLMELEDESMVQPMIGMDLTSAFFHELSQAKQVAQQQRKRKRGAADDSDAEDEVEVDDDSDEYGLQQRRAFHIPNHVIQAYESDPTREPSSAEEYLYRVRLEADACPMVKRSNIDPKQFEHKQTPYLLHLPKTVRPTNLGCLPTNEWMREFSWNFSQAKQSLAWQIANRHDLRRGGRPAGAPPRNLNDWTKWINYCLGSRTTILNDSCIDLDDLDDESTTAAETISERTTSSNPSTSIQTIASPPPNCILPHPPTLPLLISLDQIECKGLLSTLLNYVSNQIDQQRKKRVPVESLSITDSSVDASTPASLDSPTRSEVTFPTYMSTIWLYTLLLRIDPPVSDTLAGDFRHCIRQLSWQRSQVNQPESDVVKYCNIIITIGEQLGQNVEME